ncbi:MAG: Heat shock protein [Verrucomicrobiales bacterium]|nr:Heat shock protein [Verrucomicrobiales bacterium]
MMVNVLVLITISIVLSLFHVPRRIGGGNYTGLLILCFIWGMVGSVISLLLSRVMAKWMMGVKVIDPNTTDPNGRRLVETVHQLARNAGLTTMPQVGYYESPEVNAFATGPSRSRSLVAASSGLLNHMNQAEIEGVLGHECAHIANGDMVTMTLIQGVVNAFVMFFARIAAMALTSRGNDDNRGGNTFAYFMLVQVFQIAFSILGMIVIFWFSRWREFRADAGGAKYAGRGNMISALKALQTYHERGLDQAGDQQPAFQALKISGKTSGLGLLFASHPPLEERIARLEQGA